MALIRRPALRLLAAAALLGGAAGISLAAPAAADAAAYFVSPSGSDRGPGTPSRPWRSLARVNRAGLRPGDTVLFRGGSRFGGFLAPPASGSGGASIVFGSYGAGRAIIERGVWFKHRDHLVFRDLEVRGGPQGILGFGDHIAIQRCAIRNASLGVNANGYFWRIQGSLVSHTADSGLLLHGDSHVVSGNRISDTGLDRSLDYGTHGIYLKAPNSRVLANTITRFRDNGVSVRYRNSVVERNVIAEGDIGIAWFQYDARPGASLWRGNQIVGTTAAGIYVSGFDQGGRTRETFVIAGNVLNRRAGKHLDLRPTTGGYRIGSNSLR